MLFQKYLDRMGFGSLPQLFWGVVGRRSLSTTPQNLFFPPLAAGVWLRFSQSQRLCEKRDNFNARG
jgi:hypothetical protein